MDSEKAWEPYRPPWYPESSPFHHPFIPNGETGSATALLYEDWQKTLEPGELKRLVREYQRGRT